MSLKTKVKAGNITNLSDARYCAGMGVDWLSFPAHIVNPGTFKEITDWVTGPQLVLEVKESTPLDYIGQYQVASLEITSHQLDMIDRLPSFDWIITLPLSSWVVQKNELLRYKDKISYLVLDLDIQDLQAISDIAKNVKILINQSDKYSLDSLLELPIEGINVTGENELKPGLKDFDKLASILEELEVID
jgi:phosphoribosylanthranilate isomerase